MKTFIWNLVSRSLPLKAIRPYLKSTIFSNTTLRRASQCIGPPAIAWCRSGHQKSCVWRPQKMSFQSKSVVKNDASLLPDYLGFVFFCRKGHIIKFELSFRVPAKLSNFYFQLSCGFPFHPRAQIPYFYVSIPTSLQCKYKQLPFLAIGTYGDMYVHTLKHSLLLGCWNKQTNIRYLCPRWSTRPWREYSYHWKSLNNSILIQILVLWNILCVVVNSVTNN